MTSSTATLAAPTRPGFWRGYLAMWPRTGREIVLIVAGFGLAVVGYSLAWALFSAGVGLLAAFLIGVLVLTGAFYVARGIGTAELGLLEWSGLPRIARPAWRAEPGFRGWLRSLYAEPHYWLYLVFVLLPQFVVSVVTFVVLMTWIGVAAGGTAWLAWGWAVLPARTAVEHERYGGLAWLLERAGVEHPLLLEGVIQTVLGLVFLFTLPYISRGLVWARWGLARGMLGAFRSEALQEELAGAQASRAAAVAAEDSAIRRLERDIHDGPQQRLVRLQMDLASAQRRLDEDPAAARELIVGAADQAKEALEELRAVSRGIAPPILLDRGLVAALESAAVRSAVPVTISASLPEGLALPPELERNAYYIAIEAVTNAAKHAGAQRVVVRVTAPDRARLVVEVVDDGRGGAASISGHGLAGLTDRAHGLGGTLEIDSPVGGPTTVTARLPIGRA